MKAKVTSSFTVQEEFGKYLIGIYSPVSDQFRKHAAQ